jgi:hypothetical protein
MFIESIKMVFEKLNGKWIVWLQYLYKILLTILWQFLELYNTYIRIECRQNYGICIHKIQICCQTTRYFFFFVSTSYK